MEIIRDPWKKDYKHFGNPMLKHKLSEIYL